jgi:hypothetical protein
MLATEFDKPVDIDKFEQNIAKKLELGKKVRQTKGRFTFPHVFNAIGNEKLEVVYSKKGKLVICRYIVSRRYAYVHLIEIGKAESTTGLLDSFKLSVGRTGLGSTWFKWALIISGVSLVLFTLGFILHHVEMRRKRICKPIKEITNKIISNNKLPVKYREYIEKCIYEWLGIGKDFLNEKRFRFWMDGWILFIPLLALGFGWVAQKGVSKLSYEFWVVAPIPFLFCISLFAIAFYWANFLEASFYRFSARLKRRKFYLVERELTLKILELGSISKDISYTANIFKNNNKSHLDIGLGSPQNAGDKDGITPNAKPSDRINKQDTPAPARTKSRETERPGHPQSRGHLDDKLSRASSSDEKTLPTGQQVDDRLSRASSTDDVRLGNVSDEEKLTNVLLHLNEKMRHAGIASAAANKVATVNDINNLISGGGIGGSGGIHSTGGSGGSLHDIAPKGGGGGASDLSDLI